jgi:hypothetical protein
MSNLMLSRPPTAPMGYEIGGSKTVHSECALARAKGVRGNRRISLSSHTIRYGISMDAVPFLIAFWVFQSTEGANSNVQLSNLHSNITSLPDKYNM